MPARLALPLALAAMLAASGCSSRDAHVRAASSQAAPPVMTPQQRAWTVLVDNSAPAPTAHAAAAWETWDVPGDIFNGQREPAWNGAVPAHVTRHSTADLGLSQCAGTDFAVAHLNSVEFNYLVHQARIWTLPRLAAFVRSGHRVEFPPGSISLKAAWRVLHAPQDDPAAFLLRHDGPTVFGLVGINLAVKLPSGWFWATFEHKSNRCLWSNPYRQHDTWGFTDDQNPSAALQKLLAPLPSVWLNYRLVGVQTGFLDAQGRPQQLGNSVLEADLLGTHASCATCHAQSRLDPSAAASPAKALPGPECNECTGNPPSMVAPDQPLDSVWAFLCMARGDVPCQALGDGGH